MSGLGLQPRWLLNRLKTTFIIHSCKSFQVFEKAEGKDVDASKVKEKKLEVAGGKCWRRELLGALKFTGEIFIIQSLSIEGHIRNYQSQGINKRIYYRPKLKISQRPGSCLLPSFLLWWPTQSSPLSSTTMMADLICFVSVIDDINITSTIIEP